MKKSLETQIGQVKCSGTSPGISPSILCTHLQKSSTIKTCES